MAETKKNIYAKMQAARVKLQDAGLKKSGKNAYSNYDYFELGDFLPAINKINEELGIYTEISFDNENAMLKVINTDAPEEVRVFTSPMRTASLKGCHEIQNLGAVETYQRRYLYVMAYEIVESDALEATTGKEKPEGNEGNLSDKQIVRLLTIASKQGYTEEIVKKAAKKYYGTDNLKSLSKVNYDDLVSKMEQPK